MFDLPYDSELELNVTTKSTKQTGPGAKFNLSKKNFKRMGASLNLELKGSYEWQTSSTVDGESSVMNSYELGAALSLNFPRLVDLRRTGKSCPLFQDVVIRRYCIL